MLFRLKFVVVILAAIIFTPELFSQRNNDLVRVTRDGRMVWKESGVEAFFWGVNYSTPFAHAYRQIERLGEDSEKVIDADSYHFARLGLNAYRIHVWDCEISDSVGNLLQNEHLRLLDYLIHKLQQRGIYVFLTPVAYWGNGYPEPNEKTPGFSGKYNKGNVYIIPEAIEAQERYLKQFVNHVNPYTGKAYKNDPMIIGFEICNEPGHSRAAETTAFVKRMIRAVKSTGCTKPIFYNVTQSISLLEDFIRGGTDGVTFQWYPAGLVAGREIKGNYLPHVDNYYMPFRRLSLQPSVPLRGIASLRSLSSGFRGRGGFRPVQIPMGKVNEYKYRAVIPDTLIRPGILTYSIIAETSAGRIVVYPGGG